MKPILVFDPQTVLPRTNHARRRKPFFRLLSAISLVMMVSLSTQAITIVDTGTPAGALNVFGSPAGLAGEFTIANAFTVTDIQGYLGGGIVGNLTIALYSDGGDMPGTELFSTSLALGVVDPDWRGASALNWTLASGTYWVAFESRAGSTFAGRMPNAAPSPLVNEARFTQGAWNPNDDLNIGVRILGNQTVASVPEGGSTFALATLAFLALVTLRNRFSSSNASCS
jgi:hypothetical protein